MPVYEYTCQDCESVSEAIRKMADADATITCQQCGSHNTHRTLSLLTAGASTKTTSPMPITHGLFSGLVREGMIGFDRGAFRQGDGK